MPGKLQNRRRKQKICSFRLGSKEKEDSSNPSIPSLLLSKLVFENNLFFLGAKQEEVIEKPGVF